MDHTIKKLIGVAHLVGQEVGRVAASPDSLAAGGAGALSVSDVSGGLAALAGGTTPPRRITGGSNDE
jgi:hypothetical protein